MIFVARVYCGMYTRDHRCIVRDQRCLAECKIFKISVHGYYESGIPLLGGLGVFAVLGGGSPPIFLEKDKS